MSTMDDAKPPETDAKRMRLSIPTRIFIGYALIIVGFVIVSLVSFQQHERTARHMRLLDEGYVPLVLNLSEAKATQAAFSNLLERILSERDNIATRAWLNAARKMRPAALDRAFEDLDRAEFIALQMGDPVSLEPLREALEAIQSAYDKTEPVYQALFDALRDQDAARAIDIAGDLKEEEQRISRHHRRAFRILQREMSSAATLAAREEKRAAWTLILLTSFAVLFALGVMFYAYQLLRPLRALHERVSAVSRGELLPSFGLPERQDEIGRLAIEFERMVEALAARDITLRESERLAAIGRMAAHITHEIRNPLSSIGLNVELLGDELPDGESEGRELIAAIQRELERLKGITEDYLRLARTPNPEKSPLALSKLVAEILDFLSLELAGASVAIEWTDEAPDALIAADSGQLRQALVNLLRNAREAMPMGGTLSLHLSSDTTELRLTIDDEGEGIAIEAREHLFDLFYTTRERGTGLGLPLTRQIIESHGGRLSVEAREPKGTRFTLVFPLIENGYE